MPQDVGIPIGPRRRTLGLRREEVAVLAGLSPTWYTYLEQGRDIRPSPEVLNSLARVLQLTEDERRYMHILVYGKVILPRPLETDVPPDDLIRQMVALSEASPYPVYAANLYCDYLAWNKAAVEWYDDWSRLPDGERNILHWMLTTDKAREHLVDWESDTRDIIARWRAMSAEWLTDKRLQRRVTELSRLSADFAGWWHDHDVQEHRTRIRRFRHPKLGIRAMRLLIVQAPEFAPAFVVFHLPAELKDVAEAH